ncbi:hypothetical protein [Neobacillus niacini]|uniref:hypothetical protein n=1 Tax=Neobacillus niacini TaxID=86668 RepID=UPI0005EF1B13|nr:hypothetical protein [Neobacillus niacini]
MLIKKMYGLHNWFYEKEELIPESHFDGKDTVIERYLILHEDVTDIDAFNVPYIAKTLAEAEEELKYCL